MMRRQQEGYPPPSHHTRRSDVLSKAPFRRLS
jgi:hypothetical protein